MCLFVKNCLYCFIVFIRFNLKDTYIKWGNIAEINQLAIYLNVKIYAIFTLQLICTCRLSHQPGALYVEYNLRLVIGNPQNGASYLLYLTEFDPLTKQGCQILAPMVTLCFISSQTIFEKLELPTHSVCADNQCNLTGMDLVIAFIPGIFYAANEYPTFQRNENHVD